eukprot:TRINITY_DN9131_c1_g2_i1.p1 TRINITY_DN9131_c1_g2~~TRINITY_DN9131_c1_g2_i1.p1  ORF type:complete len:302 (-),score=29.69 TRINITY_DN9131_c1_g2_i1:66-971(-)
MGDRHRSQPAASTRHHLQTSMAKQQRVAGRSPILDASLAPHILAFLRPSLMIRSTCRAFKCAIERHEAPEKHQTVIREATCSTGLVCWAVDNGLSPTLAQNSCICLGDIEGLLLLLNHYGLSLLPAQAYCAARSGQVRILQWLFEQGCASRHDSDVCRSAAEGGQLEALQWPNWQHVERLHMLSCSGARTLGGAAVGARQRLPLGPGGLLRGGGKRALGGAAVGTRQWLPLRRLCCISAEEMAAAAARADGSATGLPETGVVDGMPHFIDWDELAHIQWQPASLCAWGHELFGRASSRSVL